MIEQLQFDAMLLRARAPELVLRPGMLLAARVAERQGRHGVIVLAGVPLLAELPDEVKAGDTLRLTVQEAGAERVVMRLTPEGAPPAVEPPRIPLPDGRHAQVVVDERPADGADDAASAAIALTYESPALGPIGLRLELVPGGVRARVEAAAGRAHELADDGAERLRGALEAATGRAAEVRVDQRHDPVDVYA